jgi:TonB family protein
MIRTISLLLAGVLAVPACAWAQNAPSASSQAATNTASPAAATPSDPTALMVQAARLNGLAGLLVPWHLEATYQTFDADGKPKDQGTFSEWWADKDKYKTVYTNGASDLNLTIYRYGKTSASTGSPGWIPFRAQTAQRYLVSPVPPPSAVEKLAFSIKPMNLGQVTLQCLRAPLREPDAALYLPYNDLPAVCTTEGSNIVRAIVDPNRFLVLFNKIVQIGGRYVAEDLSVRDTDLTIVNMQVTNLELLSTVNDSDFLPPATTSSLPAPVVLREIARQAIGGEAPIYPAVAKSQHVEGVVILDAVITKEGRIGELEVLSGPKALQRAAYDAVKTWKYKPYLVDGQPVEVQTQIGVMFHIR